MAEERGGRSSPEGWWSASVRAAAVLAVAFLALALVPDRLAEFLATRVSPTIRDVLITLWWGFAFVVLSVLFVGIQRRWRR